MQILVERVDPDSPVGEARMAGTVWARFLIRDADPDVEEAERAIAAEVGALSSLSRTLADAVPTRAPTPGVTGDVEVIFPIPAVLLRDVSYDLAGEIAAEVAEAYVSVLANHTRPVDA